MSSCDLVNIRVRGMLHDMDESSFSTPMMQQYLAIKKQYEDCLLFYRMGDFYEMFLDDARVGSEILDITLTSRSKGKDGKIPMAGVPYHSADGYISTLVNAGYKVAIAEQTSDPSLPGLVNREVVRVVTPGTELIGEGGKHLRTNYVAAVVWGKKEFGIAVMDITTGDFMAGQLPLKDGKLSVVQELTRLAVKEVIMSPKDYESTDLLSFLHANVDCSFFVFRDWKKATNKPKDVLLERLGGTLESWGLTEKDTYAMEAAAAIMGYITYTQQRGLVHIRTIRPYSSGSEMILDRSTMINLELFSTLREGNSEGSLFSTINRTKTSMGARLLSSWLRSPLINRGDIERRQAVVSGLVAYGTLLEQLEDLLCGVRDVERIVARLSAGLGTPRELVALRISLEIVFQLKTIFTHSVFLSDYGMEIDDDLQELVVQLKERLLEEPARDVRAGGIIASGVHPELDRLRGIGGDGKEWLVQMEQQERVRTGIGSLKVRYNRVFGYYIEVSKTNLHLVPSEYVRKQTLVNAERFITTELKSYEDQILTAEERMGALEYELFMDLVTSVLNHAAAIMRIGRLIAMLDCLVSFARMAVDNSYCCPQIFDEPLLEIEDGRHVVVEKLLPKGTFVSNSLNLNSQQSVWIITGPNMAGKSVFIRQSAILVLLAQMGSWIPATRALIGVVDRIFVRSGASDSMSRGMSTFMVEMIETASILHQATERSLVIMDEIGRGTSTFDGISIAWAVAKNLATRYAKGPLVLFATHYHELQALADEESRILNYQVAVMEHQGKPVFLHKIVAGGASHSYGLAVARLAGLPESILEEADLLLKTLEQSRKDPVIVDSFHKKSTQLGLLPESRPFPFFDELRILSVDQMTPVDALVLLAKWKKEILT